MPLKDVTCEFAKHPKKRVYHEGCQREYFRLMLPKINHK